MNIFCFVFFFRILFNFRFKIREDKIFVFLKLFCELHLKTTRHLGDEHGHIILSFQLVHCAMWIRFAYTAFWNNFLRESGRDEILLPNFQHKYYLLEIHQHLVYFFAFFTIFIFFIEISQQHKFNWKRNCFENYWTNR